MCRGSSLANSAIQARGKALQSHREAFLAAMASSAIASPLSVAAADAIAQVVCNCPFFKRSCIPACAANGSNTVYQPVMTHVLKGSVNIPEYSPCDCFFRLISSLSTEEKAAIGASLTTCLEALVTVPEFDGLSWAKLSSAVSNTVLQRLKACGQEIVDAMPSNHQCGKVSFTCDNDGFIRAALHMIVHGKLKGSYNAQCKCVSSIGKIINVNCSGTTVTKATKYRMENWLHAPLDSRISLISDVVDVTGTDVLLHLIESDMIHSIVKSHPATIIFLPTLLRNSQQVGAQAFVDKFSSVALIDRETQITDAAEALQPVVQGIAAPASMYVALIWGPPGTGKSQSAEAALFRLKEKRTVDCCMDKVNCRYASTVTSGLTLLGRRMGMALGIGPDTAADDVLEALKQHCSTIPCVT